MAAPHNHHLAQEDRAGAASSGSQPYLSPAGLVQLVEKARDSRNGTVFSALAIISWVCYLRVGEAAGIRGGAAATWARKPDLAYYKWWGRWQSTAVAMQYGTKWSDPGVVAPTILPAWSRDQGPLPTPERVGVLALWGSPMFPSIAGALNTPTKRKPRRPRGQGQGSAASGTIGSGGEGDQAATELEESAEDGSAEMGPGPEAAPTLPPLQPLASAIERGAVSREDAGQLCTVAGPLVAVGGGGAWKRGSRRIRRPSSHGCGASNSDAMQLAT